MYKCIYQVPRFDINEGIRGNETYNENDREMNSPPHFPSLSVVDIGENMGFFISKGLDSDSYSIIHYIDSLRGMKLDTFPCVGKMPMYELKDHIDKKLERFSFNNTQIRRLRDNVEQVIIEEEREQKILAFKKHTSVKKVQKRWREIISNPSFKTCKKRLIREFGEMSEMFDLSGGEYWRSR